MSLEQGVLLAVVGFVGAFFSGLLGVGGAILLIPLLMYVPIPLGMAPFDIKVASSIAIAQVAASSGAGTIANLRRGLVYRKLATVIVGAMVVGALAGGWISAFVPSQLLHLLFAVLATLGALSMLVPARLSEPTEMQPPFSRVGAVCIGLGVGIVIGMLAGGAFILVPLQVYGLGIPTRTAMATGLAAALPAAASGLVGKLIGGQVPLASAALVSAVSIPGVGVGTRVGSRLSARSLRRIYGIVVLAVAVGLWVDLFHSG
jgi:uncharacterized membrane protein YfcA